MTANEGSSAGARPLTLYRNGSVYSAADPFATAMLVDGATVAWIGSEHAATSIQDSSMAVVDLDGALIAPGFVDSHAHMTETGLALASLDLSAAKNLGEVLDAVRQAAERTSGAVLGHGWDETRWPEGRPPTAAELDTASGHRKVYLARVDAHSSVVSGTLAADGGLSQLDGWLGTGQVVREAHSRARRLSRDLTPVERGRYQDAALTQAAAAGIIAVTEMGAPHIGPAEDLLQLLGLAGEPAAAGPARPEILPYWGQAVGTDGELLELRERFGGRLRGLAGDLNIDGSIGSRTACLRSAYADAPGESGSLFLDHDAVARHLEVTTRAGVQGGFHVIGDAALDVALGALGEVAGTLGIEAVRAARHRFEHVEMADPAAVDKLSEYGITASVQPGFDAAWGGSAGMYARRLGVERAVPMNPIGSMLVKGVPVCLGSDAPVLPMDPWGAVRACIEHSNPDERISARAAFIAHTRAGWRAAGGHPLLGQLAPGTPASFAVWEVEELMVQTPDSRVQSWSTDPRARTPLLPALDTGTDPRCLQTVHHGEQLFAAGDFAGAYASRR